MFTEIKKQSDSINNNKSPSYNKAGNKSIIPISMIQYPYTPLPPNNRHTDKSLVPSYVHAFQKKKKEKKKEIH